jgi:hypothetical protein
MSMSAPSFSVVVPSISVSTLLVITFLVHSNTALSSQALSMLPSGRDPGAPSFSSFVRVHTHES